MLTHNIIKINYINLGYLPNYPYHLTSTEEMCNAFLSEDSFSYFNDTYNISAEATIEVQRAYTELVDTITFYIHKLKYANELPPDWIYSYMLGTVVCNNSSNYNIHDILVLLDCDNIDDEFNNKAEQACLQTSTQWIKKLRISKDYTITEADLAKYHLPEKFRNKTISLRPPTPFGEPHVIKSLRLAQTDIIK